MESVDDPGAAALRRVLADARPECATAAHGPNRRGGRDLVLGDVHGHFPTLGHALGERWAVALRRLSCMMTIDSPLGRVGVVHASGFANFLRSWDVVREHAQGLAAHANEVALRTRRDRKHSLLWPDDEQLAEHRDDARLREALPGIDLVVGRHSPGARPRWARRNVLCIDTGVHYGEWGHLTGAKVQRPELVLHRFARREREGTGP